MIPLLSKYGIEDGDDDDGEQEIAGEVPDGAAGAAALGSFFGSAFPVTTGEGAHGVILHVTVI